MKDNLGQNKGFDTEEIKTLAGKLKANGKQYLLLDSDEQNNDEYRRFYFIGKYEGRDVIYDAVVYTLRLHHQSELLDIAEIKAMEQFPEYEKIINGENDGGDTQTLPQPNALHEGEGVNDLEEQIGLFIADTIMELEEEGEVKVNEHAEIDVDAEYGIGLDVGLNVEKITTQVLDKFIKAFNDDKLELDETLVTFETRGEDDGYDAD